MKKSKSLISYKRLMRPGNSYLRISRSWSKIFPVCNRGMISWTNWFSRRIAKLNKKKTNCSHPMLYWSPKKSLTNRCLKTSARWNQNWVSKSMSSLQSICPYQVKLISLSKELRMLTIPMKIWKVKWKDWKSSCKGKKILLNKVIRPWTKTENSQGAS